MTATSESGFGPVQGDSDIGDCARLISLSFGGTRDKSEEWLRAGGQDQIRVWREGGVPGSVQGCLMRIPMGQFFGGLSVPMLGIAGVAVAPEARGQGVARAMMQACLKECADEGTPISTLYASTQVLYRQVGYEQAGLRFTTTINHAHVAVDRREGDGSELVVQAAGPDDEPEIRACYAAFASMYDGMLDRGEYVWKRTRQMRDTAYHGFVIRRASGAGPANGPFEGYVFLTQERDAKTGRHDVSVSDYAFLTPGAGRRIVSLLGNFGSMMQELILPGGPLHPLAHFMAQQRFKAEKKDFWMVRITDAKAALEARGYAKGIETSLNLDITDDLIPKNSGRLTLSIANGRGTVSAVGASGKVDASRGYGGLKVHVRGLAAMYSGLVSARQGVALGWVAGDEESVARAIAIFAGGTPAMTDHF